MVFSDPIFLFLFLPVILAVAYLLRKRGFFLSIFLFSLVFYFWSSGYQALLLGGSIAFNFVIGKLIARSPVQKRIWLGLGVAFNIAALSYFKYALFFAENFFLGSVPQQFLFLETIILPIGISFFTFQAISYIFDVYRGHIEPEHDFIKFGAYLSFFPQLIAGPIVRFAQVAADFHAPKRDWDTFACGVSRFTHGLLKKVLIADTAGRIADIAFAQSASEPGFWLSWLAALAYSIQIYFDFSAYSDMAIGLGMMFGIRFPENFQRPYAASTITEFWRRWHITLSTWFRDYLYIPLGGNRVSSTRIYLNLFIVFVATGVWHGAAWTFVIWGLFHGLFIIIERATLGSKAGQMDSACMRYFYLLPVIIVGWVIFRASSLGEAGTILVHMVRFDQIADGLPGVVMSELTARNIILLGVGALVFLQSRKVSFGELIKNGDLVPGRAGLVNLAYGTVGMALACAVVLSSQYSPFLYFRF